MSGVCTESCLEKVIKRVKLRKVTVESRSTSVLSPRTSSLHVGLRPSVSVSVRMTLIPVGPRSLPLSSGHSVQSRRPAFMFSRVLIVGVRVVLKPVVARSPSLTSEVSFASGTPVPVSKVETQNPRMTGKSIVHGSFVNVPHYAVSCVSEIPTFGHLNSVKRRPLVRVVSHCVGEFVPLKKGVP